MNSDQGFLPKHGNYQELKAFQKAEVVYAITVRFTRKYLGRGDRTVDQMVQAARSGKKNLLEGSKASKTSKEMEIKLTNVARASLEELLDDYFDYLRSRDLPIWDKASKKPFTCDASARNNRRPTSFTARFSRRARPK